MKRLGRAERGLANRAAGVLLIGACLAWLGFATGSALQPRTLQGQQACEAGGAAEWSCHIGRYHRLAQETGVAAALSALRRDAGRSDFVRAACHHLAHHIGHVAAQRYGSMRAARAHGDPLCGSGYFEGVVESMAARIPRDRLIVRLDALCAPVRASDGYSIDQWHCAHALGHALMTRLGNELPAALQACNTLSDGWERRRCHGGVFMENVAQATAPVPQRRSTKYFRRGQPFYPCTVVATRYRDECFAKQAFYALVARRNDFERVLDLCGEVRTGRSGCYHGLGANAAYFGIVRHITDAGSFVLARELCLLSDRRRVARASCIRGAVTEFVFDGRNSAQGRGFCRALPQDLQRGCLAQLRRLDAMIARSPRDRPSARSGSASRNVAGSRAT